MERWVRFLLRRRALVLGLTAAVTAAAIAVVFVRGRIGTSLGKLFLGETPAYREYLEKVREFATDEVIVVALEDAEPLAPETLDRLAKAEEKILELPEVLRVHSVRDAQRIRFRGGTLAIERYGELAKAAPEERAALTEALRVDPLSAGLLVSKDGRHTAVVVDLEPDEERAAERGPELVAEVERALAEAGFPPDRMRRIGLLAVLSEAVAQTHFSIERIFPYTCLVLLAVVWLLFHRVWPVTLTLGVSLVGVAWTMGFAVLLDPQVSILLAMVPAVTVIVGFSDVIHLCSAYLIELSHGRPRDEAIVASAVDVGEACVYTSATTFVGFVSMSFVPTPAFRQLGFVLGFGVAVALLLAMTLVPIAFSLMPEPKPWRVGTTSRIQRVLDRFLAVVSKTAIGKPWHVIAVSAVVLLAGAAGTARLHVETLFEDRFDPDARVRRDDEFFREHFAPANFVEVFVETPEAEGLLDPDRFRRVAAFQDAIERDPDVASVQSVVDLLRTIHGELHRDEPEAGDLPSTREALAQYVLLFEMSGGEGLRRLVDFDRRTALLEVRIGDRGMRGAYFAGRRFADLGAEHLGPAAAADVTGIRYLFGGWLDEILFGQGLGLVVSILVVGAMMAFGLRSLRLGFWSMVPNVLPLLVLGGWLGFAYDDVDSDTLALAMLAIGIAVDDTIHFLFRYRIEAARSATRTEAIRRTFDFAGRAIVMTTVVLCLGFAPFALSSYFSTWMLGTLLPLVLVVALLADLMLTPALVRVGALAFPDEAR